jgi:hypothetical protein
VGTHAFRRLAAHGPEFAAAALLAASLAAVWIPRHLPMVDLPEHRAFVAVTAALSEDPPHPAYEPWYRLRGPSALYGAVYYRPAAWLRAPELVARLELTLALALWAAGALALARRLGTSRRNAALAVPLLVGGAWHWGFLPYIVALPAVPWALWAALGLARPPPSGRRAALLWGVLIASIALSALGHLVAAGLALLGAAVLWFPRPATAAGLGRWVLRTGLVGAAPAAIAALQAASGRPRLPTPAQPIWWPSLGDRLGTLADWAAPGPRAWLGGAFLAAVFALVALDALGEAYARRPPAAAPEVVSARVRMAALAGLVLASALLLPRHALDVHYAAERLAPLAALLLLLVPRTAGVDESRRGWPIASLAVWAAALVLGAVTLAAEAWAGAAYSREVGNIDRIVELVPPGSRVLVFPIDGASGALPRDVPLHLHTASRVVERRGGVVSIPPLANVGMHVELTDEGLEALVVPERGDGRVEVLLRRLRDWDYVLVYSRGGFPADAFAPFAPFLEAVVPPEHRGGPYAGPWYLLRVAGHRQHAHP